MSTPDVSNVLCSTVAKVGNWTLAPNDADSRNLDAMESNDDQEKTRKKRNREKFTQGTSTDIIYSQINYTVVLATACLRIQIGTFISPICRAIIDTGAQASLISNACVKRLGLQTKQCYAEIEGVGGSVVFKRKVEGFITPRYKSDFSLYAQFLVGDDFDQTHPKCNWSLIV